MKAFQLNEELKENLVLHYKAKQAITTHYPFGITFMPERFLETIVYWDIDVDTESIENALKDIEKNIPIFNKYAYFDGPIYQESEQGPTVVWALFDKEKNVKKGIDYLSPTN